MAEFPLADFSLLEPVSPLTNDVVPSVISFKVQLKLAINRLKLLQQKKTAGNSAARRDIAALLENHKDDSARVRVEHIIREDFAIEAMEILELYCEMLLARFGLLEEMRNCDPSISEAVNTIIYAAPRCEVKELLQVRDQLIAKFGKEFGLAAIENTNEVVNPRIVHKLRIQTPDPILVDKYLKTIANAFNIEWEGSALDEANLLDEPPGPPGTLELMLEPVNPQILGGTATLESDLSALLPQAPAPATTAPVVPGLPRPPQQPVKKPPVDNVPTPPPDSASNTQGSQPPSSDTDFDELTRRMIAIPQDAILIFCRSGYLLAASMVLFACIVPTKTTRAVYHYGKTLETAANPTKPSKKPHEPPSLFQNIDTFLASLTVPKHWFTSFYIVGFSWSLVYLFLLVVWGVDRWPAFIRLDPTPPAASPLEPLLCALLMVVQTGRRLVENLMWVSRSPSDARMHAATLVVGFCFYLAAPLTLTCERLNDLRGISWTSDSTPMSALTTCLA
ncbi:hypothetical protein HDU96_007823 [Phlyctochytrium bullatum]|nr:hypothetical protein HDU96_007823 [Phlyctochytrium bullatum]